MRERSWHDQRPPDYSAGAVLSGSCADNSTPTSFRVVWARLPPSPSQVFTSASYSLFSLRLRMSIDTVRSTTTEPVAASPSATNTSFFKRHPFEIRVGSRETDWTIPRKLSVGWRTNGLNCIFIDADHGFVRAPVPARSRTIRFAPAQPSESSHTCERRKGRGQENSQLCASDHFLAEGQVGDE